MIFALGSRKFYCDKAIEVFREMQMLNLPPDNHTYVAVMRACAKIGDIPTAADCLNQLRAFEMPITHYIYTMMIKTYAGAIKRRGVSEERIDLFLGDIWKLLQ